MRLSLLLFLTLAVSACDTLGIGSSGDKYQGNFSGSLAWHVTSNVTCTSTYAVTGTVTLQLQQSGANVTGDGDAEVTQVPGPATPSGCGAAPTRKYGVSGPVSGTTSNITFTGSNSIQGAILENTKATFSGALANGVVTGTLTIELSGSGQIDGKPVTDGGTASFPVSLRR